MSFVNPANIGNVLQSAMEEVEEMEKMVMAFRIQELKSLLTFSSHPAHGRKSDMLHRALHLVRTTKNALVKQKVKQLHRQIYDRDRLLLESNYPNGMPPTANGVASQYGIYGPTMSVTVPSNSAPTTAGGGRVVTAAGSSNMLAQCAARQNIEMHPPVKLTHLPFYDVLVEVMKPTTLVPLAGGKFQDNHLTFNLNREQISMITFNDKAPLPRVELQLRFTLLDLKGEQKDDFPTGCVLRMNDRVVTIPNPIPTNKVGVEPKRPSRPVEITPYVSRAGQGGHDQRIHVSWQHDGVRFWTVSVYIVRHLTTKILLDRVKAKGDRSEVDSVSMIKKKLGDDECDREIAATSLRVSLLCPLGKIRMRLPCRLRACNHLQCFDLELFLQMNEKKPTWTCPVCDIPTVPFGDLQVDGYFTRLIAETTNVSEVELYVGGGYSPVIESDAVDLDDDDTTAVPKTVQKPKTPPSTSGPSTSGSGAAPKPKQPARAAASDDDCVIIDLCSDDEEERSQPAPVNSTSKTPPASNGRSCELDSISNASSSPSLIILDTPSPPHGPVTPEDPRTSAEGPLRSFSFRMKRPLPPDSNTSNSNSSNDPVVPSKRGRTNGEAEAVAGTSSGAAGLPKSPNQRFCDDFLFRHLFSVVDMAIPPSTSYPGQYAAVPPPPAPVPSPYPMYNGTYGQSWSPMPPSSNGSSSSTPSMGSSSVNNTPGLPGHLQQEFDAFMKSFMPSTSN